MTDPSTPQSSHKWRQWRVASLLAIALAAVLGLLWWFDPARSPVPLCSFHALTGLYCPGCGALRATHELLHGRLLSALHDNALWTLSLPLIFYLGGSQLWATAGHRPWPAGMMHTPGFWIGLAFLAALFFAIRNLPWGPFTWLAPLG